MAKTVTENTYKAGETVADVAKTVGCKIAQGAEVAVDFVKEKTGIGSSDTTAINLGLGAIREHMNVIASCGKKVGVVDGVEMDTLKLARKDSPDNRHHFIPIGWVSHIDGDVHLNKNSLEVVQGWKLDASSCGCST